MYCVGGPLRAFAHAVTAKLSLAFYEKLGEAVANELVDWFNAVDATYRADLRELNELNFARFDAKVEQRLSALESRLEARISQSEARLTARMDRIDARFEQIEARFQATDQRIEDRFSLTEERVGAAIARLDASLQKGLRQNLQWTITMWVSVLVALILRS